MAFALCAVGLAIGIAAITSAAKVEIPIGDLDATLSITFAPKALPKSEYVPVKANVFGEVSTADGSHPSALREIVVDIDKDVKVNVKGYPLCKAGLRDMRGPNTAKEVCGEAILGSGIAHLEIAFPGQPPILVTGPITAFNGGEKGGKVKLLIHTFITVPVPAAIVTQVTIQRKGSRIHSISKIPVAAGGSGSLVDFKFKIGRTYRYKGKKRSFLEAKCPDGKFNVNVPKMLFKNEAQVPGVPPQTVFVGKVPVPCTPKG